MTSKEKTLKRLECQEKINAEEMQKNGRVSLLNRLKTEYLKELLKDLEDYEEIKSLMGTPIQELMNKLKELETVKAFVLNYTAFYDTGCCLDEYIYYDSEIGTLFKKWNDE